MCIRDRDNPIIPASGTFGFGYEFAELYDINMLGTFSFKGTTREPRFGNPTPRIAEYAGGLLNAVGLQNPGVDAVIETELPKLKQVFHKPVMANISGFSVAEYAEVCEKLDAQEQVGWLEVNISCPNVHGGGAAFGADPKSAEMGIRDSGCSPTCWVPKRMWSCGLWRTMWTCACWRRRWIPFHHGSGRSSLCGSAWAEERSRPRRRWPTGWGFLKATFPGWKSARSV